MKRQGRIGRLARADLEVMEDASRATFSPRVARWLVGLGAVSLLATLLFAALGSDDTPSRFEVKPNTFSRSAVGHKALAAVLDAWGLDVHVSRHRSAERATRTRPLLLLEPEAPWLGDNALRDTLRVAVKRRVPVVVVLPKWSGERSATVDWARRVDLVETSSAERVLAEIEGALDHTEGDDETLSLPDWGGNVWRTHEQGYSVYLRGAQREWRVALAPIQGITTSDDGPLEPLVEVAAADAFPVLVARFRDAPIYVVSDPDLVNTMGLGQADHVAILHHLLTVELAADGVIIDEAVHGFSRVESIWSELFRFPLIVVTFHFALLLALALWAAMRRFGKPMERPPRVARGKTTLLDNTATLLALGHHAGHGVREYFRATLRWLARTYGLPSELSDAERLKLIADLAKRRGASIDVHALAAEARSLVNRRADERRALQVARRIFTLRTEMIDGARAS